MLKATEKAVLASIKHWEKDGVENPKRIEMTAEACSLCRRFEKKCARQTRNGITERCPVFCRTGNQNCTGSPYWMNPTKRQAQRMVAFLKSLLPESKP